MHLNFSFGLVFTSVIIVCNVLEGYWSHNEIIA